MKSTTPKTGAGTADEIITTLNSHTLDTNELYFQSYDFTTSMPGQFKGAQQKLGGDPEAEFNRKHRVRRPPSRIDDNPDPQVTLTMMQFYRR